MAEDVDALDRLFTQLFEGEPSAGALCTLIDQIGSAKPLRIVGPSEIHLLAQRQYELSLAGIRPDMTDPHVFACAEPAMFEAFHERKDKARRAFHNSLEIKLNARLSALLAEPSPIVASLDHSKALRTLRTFLAAHLLPGAPLLSGLRAALRYQLRSRVRVLWVVDDAAFLNMGYDRVGEAVKLVRALGLWVAPPSALLEGGGLLPTQRCWALLPGAWTRSQVSSIVAAIRVDFSVAPTGRIVTQPLEPDEAPVLRRDPNPLRDWCEVL